MNSRLVASRNPVASAASLAAIAILASAASTARAVDQVFVDNFNNASVENSDSVPNFWTQVNLGAASTATDSGAGALTLAARDAGYPQAEIVSNLNTSFNFFHAPIVLQVSGLNFNAGSSSKSVLQFGFSSQKLDPTAPSEYQAEDAYALRFDAANTLGMGLKTGSPNANTEFDRAQLINNFNPNLGRDPALANLPGQARSFKLVISPSFYSLAVTFDTSATDSTPQTRTYTGATDEFLANWQVGGVGSGDLSLFIQSQLNNANNGEVSSVNIGQVSVGKLVNSWTRTSGGGDWRDATAWSDQDVLHTNPDLSTSSTPDYTGANAKFGPSSAPQTISVNVIHDPFDPPDGLLSDGVAAGVVIFDSAQPYTIAGDGILHLGTRWLNNDVQVLSGSHTIAVPIFSHNNSVFTIASNSSLNVSGGINESTGTQTWSKEGAGTLSAPNYRVTSLAVNGGTLKVTASGTANAAGGVSRVANVSIASGAKLDLTNNSMIVDYTGSSPLQTVRQHLAAGRIATSSTVAPGGGTAAIGYGEASVVAPGATTFDGLGYTGDALLLKYTYAGDTNLDGKVDIVDLGKLAGKWQQTGVWTDGDVNYDGTVNIVDLGLLAGNWQKGVSSPLGEADLSTALAALGLPNVSVPEPMSLGMIGLGAMGVISRRRRGRDA